ncbi:hypothetical protein KDH83_22580 [Achromobacter sp. Marseille-Q0513]|nr:hypothetical protein [Achromobacter sp. Marseille-Q0513]
MAVLACLWALPITTPAPALAAITVTGKTSSTIKAYVKPLEFIAVTNELGGWQDNLEMQQLGAWNTPYEVALRLRVTSLPNKFQVRLDAPLVLQNAKNQVFRQPVVTLAPEGGAPKPLLVGQSAEFENPAPSVEGTNSVGMYALKVAALPPEGDFRDVAGTYQGVLSMTFEPVAIKP